MIYQLDELNLRAKNDPRGLIEQCEANYHNQVNHIADMIAERQHESPVVLLCGASSAGKTTTMDRIGRALQKRHLIHAETISMDDYYRTNGSYDVPHDDENNIDDLESPLCMNLELLGEHLRRLVSGEEIRVPAFDFAQRKSIPEVRSLSLDPGEVVIIEGIHALSDIVIDPIGSSATGIFLSFDSQLQLPNGDVITSEMLRFMRRAVRDSHFRNSPVEQTLEQWKSVRRGERLYILPNRSHAEWTIDTYLPYESFIISRMLQDSLCSLHNQLTMHGFEPLCELRNAFEPLNYIPYIPENSLLHEFIG